MRKIIDKKKRSIYFVQYESGLYAVEKCTKALGMTYFASFDYDEARRYFDSI
jgi:hypothetical protein